MASHNRHKPKVQGSADPRLILVSHKAGYTGRRRLLIALSIMAALLGGYLLGAWQSRQKIEALQPGEILQLITEKARLEAELQEFRYLAAHSQHGQDLEQVTVEQVRQENLQKQRRISELETELAFYRGIMAPEQNGKQGLIIEKFELEALQEQGRYRFKIVLIQVENIRNLIAGQYEAILVGRTNDGRHEISFAELSGQIAESAQFRFRYFQSITGDIALPDGFIPEQVRISAQTQGRNAVTVERRFDWKL